MDTHPVIRGRRARILGPRNPQAAILADPAPNRTGGPLPAAIDDEIDAATVGLGPPEVAPTVASIRQLTRSFVFADVCGFTSYCEQHGDLAAIEVLNRFRSVARAIAARRGVRVAKWLGDGVMMVSIRPGAAVAAGAELVGRMHGSPIQIRVGVAGGPVLLFEGDDYIGRPVNVASRLCDAAAPGEILASGHGDQLLDWVSVGGTVTARIDGLGDLPGVQQLTVVPDVIEALRPSTAA